MGCQINPVLSLESYISRVLKHILNQSKAGLDRYILMKLEFP